MRMMTGGARAAIVVVAAAVPVGAGAGIAATASAAPARAGGAHVLTLAANTGGLLKYNKSSLTVAAGSVKIEFTNRSPIPHNVVLINSKNKVLGRTPVFTGGTKSFTVNLAVGKYTYYCSVPGHRAGGMVGTLKVT